MARYENCRAPQLYVVEWDVQGNNWVRDDRATDKCAKTGPMDPIFSRLIHSNEGRRNGTRLLRLLKVASAGSDERFRGIVNKPAGDKGARNSHIRMR